MKDLGDVLGQELILGDGAMGTWLLSQGADASQLPLIPLTQPDIVLRAHLAYLEAGARLIETHTFSANPSKLAALGLQANVSELNRRAAQIARHSRDMHGSEAYILGSLGPLAVPVESRIVAGLTLDQAVAQFEPVVAGLLSGGVDGFIVETMSDVFSIQAAVAAIRRETDLPIIVSFAFSRLGTTLYGLTPEQAVRAVLELPGGPPTMVGANCGTGPALLLDAVLRMAESARKHSLPIAGFPNAGEPYLTDGGIAYPASADYMGALAPSLKAAGCAVIGGCCGTGPSHIRAISESLRKGAVLNNWPSVTTPREDAQTSSEPPAALNETILDLIESRFLVSVELDPPHSPNLDRFLASARVAADAGAQVINVADSPMARVRLSAVAAARLVQERVGVQPLLHFTTRDRNLMGIQSDLLGAYALGIRNILALTGDPPGLGDYAHATAVYDIDSVGLVKTLRGLNNGEDAVGQPLGSPTAFAVGVGLNPTADDLEREVGRLVRKAEAGAQFCLTQPMYGTEPLLRFLDLWGSRDLPPLILGVMPLVSFRQAMYLNNEVPGIVIPDAILKRMESSSEPVQVGTDLAIGLLQEVLPLVRGVYLVPSFNRVNLLLPILQTIAELKAPNRPVVSS